ncbi:pyridoxal phosphate-dependent aminotransferase [Limnochorda pilosa]|uniref:Aminotransferase n=1 Tax=Limnochorda pilosa TaxID=1555112 RepID=A0A0K2SGU5_LIMPI|nr:pyridoxal phosphate-dependent aminotransferase [Limnochorda pilosa]BAS26247.1 aspartate aminotransferase [Limnochorda pilosa]
MVFKTSTRVRQIPPSATVAIADKARALRAQGVAVIDLAGGEPDCATPAHIVEAGHRAMQEGFTHYVGSRGIPELLEAIAESLEARIGIRYDPRRQLIVTPGGKYALFSTLAGLLDGEDEVLVPEPAWVSYAPMVRLAGATPVPVRLDPEDGWRLTEARLTERLTSRSRIILLNTPNNPTGRVLTDQELEAVASIARRHDLLVISDEVYDRLVYDGRTHKSVLTLPGMAERTLLVNSFSKTYAMTGWRLGYLAGPEPAIPPILKVVQHSMTCAPSFVQRAGVVALRGPQEALGQMLETYAGRRRFVVEGLNAMPGISCSVPEGAFYAFFDVRETGMSSADFASRMLDRAAVALTPGAAFGEAGEGFVRLSFAAADENLHQALERMEAALKG